MIQVRNIAHIFLFLGVIAIPFEFLFFRPYTEILRFIWQPLTNGIAQFLGLELKLHDLSSDSLGLYILLILIFLVASTFVLIFQQKRWFDRLVAIAKLISACYLGMVLIRYGLDKVLMIQFPKPGPNLLFTPFGMQDRDILFWSVMGLSPTYMITTGLIEVIAGVLLLFTRTRAIGGLLGLAIMSHVFLLNISFDISVKLFSLFLLLQALAASFPL